MAGKKAKTEEVVQTTETLIADGATEVPAEAFEGKTAETLIADGATEVVNAETEAALTASQNGETTRVASLDELIGDVSFNGSLPSLRFRVYTGFFGGALDDEVWEEIVKDCGFDENTTVVEAGLALLQYAVGEAGVPALGQNADVEALTARVAKQDEEIATLRAILGEDDVAEMVAGLKAQIEARTQEAARAEIERNDLRAEVARLKSAAKDHATLHGHVDNLKAPY